ncbi:MAG: hypothetical protein FWG69_03215 [Oscillospiraceae bacterium]|nr:hypothetical protein [Oscillospiraceae bacterium]
MFKQASAEYEIFKTLINCDKDCAYQQEGNCGLDSVAKLSSGNIDGCCYYKNPELETQNNALSS